ncbi:hypothetical protein GGR56DRAFT_514025 [Xylariaceae sp. FL0804]|nr:hypothetical protein GGR56DRAFT_514025 [Xylariaceae sp. FL0804]
MCVRRAGNHPDPDLGKLESFTARNPRKRTQPAHSRAWKEAGDGAMVTSMSTTIPTSVSTSTSMVKKKGEKIKKNKIMARNPGRPHTAFHQSRGCLPTYISRISGTRPIPADHARQTRHVRRLRAGREPRQGLLLASSYFCCIIGVLRLAARQRGSDSLSGFKTLPQFNKPWNTVSMVGRSLHP